MFGKPKKEGIGIPCLSTTGEMKKKKKILLFHICLCVFHNFFHRLMENGFRDPGVMESTELNGSCQTYREASLKSHNS